MIYRYILECLRDWATGRVSSDQWQIQREACCELAGGMCRVCGARGHDPHHMVKRSAKQSSDALENLLWVCRTCHDRFDWPYTKGRLVAEWVPANAGYVAREAAALGLRGTVPHMLEPILTVWLVWGGDKWTPSEQRWLMRSWRLRDLIMAAEHHDMWAPWPSLEV